MWCFIPFFDHPFSNLFVFLWVNAPKFVLVSVIQTYSQCYWVDTGRNIPFSYLSSTCEMVKSSGWMIPIQLCERGVWNPVVAERLRHSLDIYSAVWNCFIIHVILHHHWLDLYLFTRVKFKTANGSDVWNPNQPMAVVDDNAFTRMKLDIKQSGCASLLPLSYTWRLLNKYTITSNERNQRI